MASGIVSAKKEMRNYSEELGWEITIDKNGCIYEDGERRYEVKAHPKGDDQRKPRLLVGVVE